MMSLRKNLGLGVLFVIVFVFVMSPHADAKRKTATPQSRMDLLKSRLKLTQAQETQIYPILVDEVQRQNALVANLRSVGPQARKKLDVDLETLWLETESKIKPLLREDQLDEFIRIRVQQRIKRDKRKKAVEHYGLMHSTKDK